MGGKRSYTIGVLGFLAIMRTKFAYKRSKMVVIWLFASFLKVFSAFSQGAIDGFLKGKSQLDLAFSLSQMSAKEFIATGGYQYSAPFKAHAVSMFFEYGLSKRLDIVGTANYIFTSTENGFQDGSLYLKYRPFYKQTARMGRFGLIGAGGMGFPLAQYNVTNTGALGQRAQFVASRIGGQWETPHGLFGFVIGGYDWRLDRLVAEDIARIRKAQPDFIPVDPPNSWVVLSKIGFAAAHFYLDAWVERRETIGGDVFQPRTLQLAQSFDQDFVQIGGTVYYTDTGKNGVYLSMGTVVKGVNIAKSQRWTIGAIIKWNTSQRKQ